MAAPLLLRKPCAAPLRRSLRCSPPLPLTIDRDSPKLARSFSLESATTSSTWPFPLASRHDKRAPPRVTPRWVPAAPFPFCRTALPLRSSRFPAPPERAPRRLSFSRAQGRPVRRNCLSANQQASRDRSPTAKTFAIRSEPSCWMCSQPQSKSDRPQSLRYPARSYLLDECRTLFLF